MKNYDDDFHVNYVFCFWGSDRLFNAISISLSFQDVATECGVANVKTIANAGMVRCAIIEADFAVVMPDGLGNCEYFRIGLECLI